MAKGIDRKQLRQPDEFVSFWTKVGAWGAANRRSLTIGGGALAVVIVVGLTVSSWRERSESSASEAFERIQKTAVAELLPAEGQAPAYDDGVAHFKTEKERREAAVKECDAFIAAHGGSPLKVEAQLLKGAFLLDLGRNDEAAALYDQLAQGGLDRSLRFLAYEGAGYAREAKGDLDGALAAFARLADESGAMGGFYRDRALFHKARLLEKKGDGKGAAVVYHEIMDKLPTTALRDEISSRLAALESK